MRTRQVLIVGAGVGGLVAALRLAHQGCAVTLLETALAPGGKMRRVSAGAASIDAGPTVLTMRWIFDEIFAEAGTALDAHLTLRQATVLARHAWSASERLDLFADVDRSAEAIGAFAGPREGAGYRAFAARAARMFQSLEQPFMRAQRPRLDQLVASFGWRGLRDLGQISPFATMNSALREHFRDPRLLQLFGRYATYCGSSPFLAPATLMLVAHAEQRGVWLVQNGMHALAEALASCAQASGAVLRYGTAVREITVAQGRAAGVVLSDGERLTAEAVLVNADASALPRGLFGEGVVRAAPPVAPSQRSLSAITCALHATANGFPLTRHNVFFSRDYAREFDAIRAGRVPGEPTVYVCAQDRGGDGSGDDLPARGPERLLCLINAPATGDADPLSQTEVDQCLNRSFARLERCGLRIDRPSQAEVTTDPAAFHQLFPGTGGALYGPASHGWRASFSRAGSRGMPGLYLAGGSVHPGPGVPMAAISGRLAAAAILTDFASARQPPRTATSGGTSTRSATTAPMP